jgi:hypothetical protein
MKTFTKYIFEKIKLSNDRFNKIQPKTKKELIDLIATEISKHGTSCDLNHIDISNVYDLTYLFASGKNEQHQDFGLFDGNISEWKFTPDHDIKYMFFFNKKIRTNTQDEHTKLNYIGDNMFNKTSITELELSNVLNGNIGEHSFYLCMSLKTIKTTNDTPPYRWDNYDICEGAFTGCHNLKTVELPYNIKTIDEHAFDNCINLETIILPGCLESINRYAFRGCVNIKKIEFKQPIKNIGFNAFGNCKSLKEIIYPGPKNDFIQIINSNSAFGGYSKFIVKCSDGEFTVA